MTALTLADRAKLAIKAFAGQFSPEMATLAHGLLAGVLPLQTSAPKRNTTDYLNAYSTMPWFRAVAARIAFDVAACRWHLYAVGKPEAGDQQGKRIWRKCPSIQRGGAEYRRKAMTDLRDARELVEIEEHPLLGAIEGGNPFMTGLTVRKVTQIHLDTVGDAFWLLERGALGQPIAIWPVPPDWVRMMPTPSYPFYRIGYRGWQVSIPAVEFVWLNDPDPANPYGRGSGTARSLGDEMDTDEYAAKHMKGFFYNHARPDIVVMPKGEGDAGTIGDSERLRLEQAWTANSGGFWRAFRPLFASRAMDIKVLEQNFQHLQMKELREFERNTIIQVFGVSPAILGVMEAQAPKAALEAAALHYATYVLVPRLELQRTILQEQLVPQYDQRLILEYESPVKEDSAQHLEAAKEAPWCLNADEWRKLAGHGPLPNDEGKVYMVPVGLTPTPSLAADEFLLPPEPDVPPDMGPSASDEGDAADSEQASWWVDQLSQDELVLFEAGDGYATKQVRKALAEDPDALPPLVRMAARLEPRLRRAFLLAAMRARESSQLDKLADAIASGQLTQVEAYSGALALAQNFKEPLRLNLVAGFLTGAGYGIQELRDIGVAMRFDLMNPHAATYAKRATASLITEIGNQAREAVREKVRGAVEEGLTPAEIARQIRDEGIIGLHSRQVEALNRFREKLADEGVKPEKLNSRAERYGRALLRQRTLTIARTETMRAANGGQMAAWQDAKRQGLIDSDATRRWTATADDRIDLEICEPLDGEETGLNEDFIVPTGSAKGEAFHSPPAHPNCRCSLVLNASKKKSAPTLPDGHAMALAAETSGHIAALWRGFEGLKETLLTPVRKRIVKSADGKVSVIEERIKEG